MEASERYKNERILEEILSEQQFDQDEYKPVFFLWLITQFDWCYRGNGTTRNG